MKTAVMIYLTIGLVWAYRSALSYIKGGGRGGYVSIASTLLILAIFWPVSVIHVFVSKKP